MKKSLIAVSLGLAAALAGTGAFATTGTINFEGKITSTTCPIEVVNPGDGAIGNVVKMGSIEASRFTGTGLEYSGKRFALRLTDDGNCGLKGSRNIAKVTFNGMADTSGKYFAITPTADGARGVAISLRDQSGHALPPGSQSSAYELIPGASTDMLFDAYYRSTSWPVSAGVASADVQFVVAIN